MKNKKTLKPVNFDKRIADLNRLIGAINNVDNPGVIPEPKVEATFAPLEIPRYEPFVMPSSQEILKKSIKLMIKQYAKELFQSKLNKLMFVCSRELYFG